MKTLNELYDEAHLRQDRRDELLEEDANPSVAIPNEGEIRSYYVLYQLDNGGEVRVKATLVFSSVQQAIHHIPGRKVPSKAPSRGSESSQYAIRN